MIRRLLAVPMLALAALVLTATAAAAHVEVDPDEAVAGSTATLTFSFHHGKDGTATTGLEVLLPEGALVVDVPAVEGWASTVDEDAGTITWSGGSVPDGDDGVFPVVVQLPITPGVTLFKAIQTTEAGELAWIEEDEDPEEGSYPSPRLTLTADPSAPTTTEATTTTATDAGLPGTTLEAEQRDGGGSSLVPWVIGSGVAAALAILVGGLVLRSRAG